MKKFGFSMSEVLITLGVIGVVSAMTLPLIHSKIQDYILKNRFKKVYNTYASAIQMINTENGGAYDCYYYTSGPNANITDCRNFFTLLSKQLKYTKYCPNNAFEKGCIPEYSRYFSETGSGCGGFRKSFVNFKSRAWILNDGSLIFTYNNGVGGEAPLFAVDINGLAKPNKGGYDLFIFRLVKNNDIVKLDQGVCNSFKENGGKTVKEMLLN